MCGYRSPLIHSGNKHEAIYDKHDLVLRRNVIVMGDIIEDSFMVRENFHDTILRVGFMNEENPTSRIVTCFRNNFDLIVSKDGSLCPVNASLMSMFD